MGRALSGRVALVTGAGIRLGQAIALALAEEGASVAVHYRASQQGAEDTAARIRQAGGVAECFRADLEADGAAPLATQVRDRLGPVSILVNSAARFDRADLLDTSPEVLEGLWRLNARAPFLLAQAVVPQMRTAGSGDIVNILDLGGTFVPWRHYAAYCMTKAALGMLTQCLSLELAPEIRVNGVAPGTVLPPEAMGSEERERLRKRIPLQRFGAPEDVARTVLFLLTGPAFITGQIVAVDGGRMRNASLD